MTYTETEARTKWCPFGRSLNEGGNRPAYGEAGDGPVEEDYCGDVAMTSPCIGSGCMAWRWNNTRAVVQSSIDGSTRTLNEGDSYSIITESIVGYEPDGTGYCGLAGGPA